MRSKRSVEQAHIAFVGFEVQRVTEPLVRLDARRVHLVTGDPNDVAKPYWDQVGRVLSQYPLLEVRKHTVDPWDLGEIVRLYRGIFHAETAAGRKVFVNVSTGTKVAVMAGMLSCMMWAGTAYYAKRPWGKEIQDQKANPPVSHDVHGIYEAVEDIYSVPVLRVPPPADHELKIVEALIHRPLAKDELIRALLANGGLPLDTDPRSTATYNKLNRWLDALREKNYVGTMGERKAARVFLTPAGIELAKLLVLPWADAPRQLREMTLTTPEYWERETQLSKESTT